MGLLSLVDFIRAEIEKIRTQTILAGLWKVILAISDCIEDLAAV